MAVKLACESDSSAKQESAYLGRLAYLACLPHLADLAPLAHLPYSAYSADLAYVGYLADFLDCLAYVTRLWEKLLRRCGETFSNLLNFELFL